MAEAEFSPLIDRDTVEGSMTSMSTTERERGQQQRESKERNGASRLRGSDARRDNRSNGKQSHRESRKKAATLPKIVGCSSRVENVILDYRYLKYILLKNCHVVKIHQIVKFRLSH